MHKGLQKKTKTNSICAFTHLKFKIMFIQLLRDVKTKNQKKNEIKEGNSFDL